MTLKHSFLPLPLVVAGGLLACSAYPVESGATPVSFSEHIRPILNRNCVGCHGGVKKAGKISFIYREDALGEGKSGETVIVPGDPEASNMLARITADDPDDLMPPAEHGPPLDMGEIAMIKKWISEGAVWEEHWAFVPPEAQPLPEVDDTTWPRSGIDHFILARLEAEGLGHSPGTTRATWLRRAAFDLTGLPPAPEDLATFEADKKPGAYGRAADRLLDSPRFGERWASVWLDLARYADTQGYEKDNHRDIWPYRDWVIRAFNTDMPYNDFTVKQLAGDLLPAPSLDDLMATAFHRNTQTNTEGGTDDEEFRTAAVLDRVNTTWQVWLATTFGCIQCHAHPYDPFEHEDYYKFVSYFNTTRDHDLDTDMPRLKVPADPAQNARVREIGALVKTYQEAEFDQTRALAEKGWTPFSPNKATSTGSTVLTIGKNGDTTEIVAGGTLTEKSRFTIEGELPGDVDQVTALRIDALPKDIQAALTTPETGFVLSKIDASVKAPGAKKWQQIFFTHVFADEPSPIFDPQKSLNKGVWGWASYPKISQPRYAVFVPSEPVAAAPGSQLRIVCHQDQTVAGRIPTLITRAHFSLSADLAWTDTVTDPVLGTRRELITDLKKERETISGITVPVMGEEPPEFARRTHMFERGNWLDKGREVTPGLPKIMSPEGTPKSATDRLDMARWIVSPENPLTARVAVNRFWEQLFGTGIVETLEDFGSSGSRPSHPALLDYLALRFQNELGWGMKALLREIVLSSTYRQDSRATPELLDKDPRNRLLARGPRQRLTAEMVRDQALVASGLLSEKMFGPPVMPPQPDGIWRSIYSSAKWVTSEGENSNRRALYTYWKRTSGYPSFLTFDAPSREVCSVRRTPTNTPLQALVTLNDPVYISCARALARQMLDHSTDGVSAGIHWGYRHTVGTTPSPEASTALGELYNDSLSHYLDTPSEARALGDSAPEAAMTTVANSILNLDATLTR